MIEAKVILDSISHHGIRLTTLQVRLPKLYLAEWNTHRVFSRSASSSRAIPNSKISTLAANEMYEPIRWGLNKPGMQASDENLSGEALAEAKQIWREMGEVCLEGSKRLAELGLHKQWSNRPIEWLSYTSIVVTSTEWDNFFELRNHPDAQPEMEHVAKLMSEAMSNSTPTLLGFHDWHLPFITDEDRSALKALGWPKVILAKISAARCARVSYLKHDGTTASVEEDLALYDRLVGSVPRHASPTEHQAYPFNNDRWCKNFRGWRQLRDLIEQGEVN